MKPNERLDVAGLKHNSVAATNQNAYCTTSYIFNAYKLQSKGKGNKMPQKLSKTWSYLKKILRKQDEMWEMIENDYQNTLKIQRKTIRTYNIMLKHHTNMEHILETINKSYDAIIELGKNIKEGKRVIADMKGIMMEEGGNFDNIKLDEEEDNKKSREITTFFVTAEDRISE